MGVMIIHNNIGNINIQLQFNIDKYSYNILEIILA